MDEITNKGTGGQFRAPRRPQSIPVGGAQAGRRPTSGGDMKGLQGRDARRENALAQMKKRSGGSGRFSLSQSGENDEKTEKTINILDKVIAFSVFMLFFGLPIFFLNKTYQGIAFEKQYYFYLWTFLGVVALIAQGMLGGKIEIRRTTLDIPLGIFWIAIVLSTFFSVDRYHSIFGFFGSPVNGLISITAIILAYYLVVSYVSREKIGIIWGAIVASGSLVVVWSFLATTALIPATVLQKISPSLTGSFTSLAIFLGMMIPVLIMSLALWGSDSTRVVRSKVLTGIFFAILFIDLITLSALYGYVQWFLVFGIVGLLLVFTISNLVKVPKKVTMVTLVAFLTLFFFWMWERPVFSRVAIQPEASISYPLSFTVAKEAFKSNPILGSGPSTYGYNFSLYRPSDLNQSGQYDLRIYSDRGLLMESISTLGLFGVIGIAIVVLTYISTVVHSFLRSEDEEMKTISLGLFAASVLALGYSLFWAGDGAIVLIGSLLAAVTIGLLRSSLGDGVDDKLSLSMKASPQYALSFAFLSILIAVGVIFGFVTLGKVFVADVYAGNALQARANGDFVRSTELFNKATLLNNQEGRYFTVISQYALGLANFELSKSDEERNDEVVQQYVQIAVGTATLGRDLMPNDVLANETQGFIYENSGSYVPGALSVAAAGYERAGELEPLNPYIDIALGKLKLVEAQLEQEDAVEQKKALIGEAKERFETAREKTTFKYQGQDISLFAAAHYYVSVVEEALENVDEAINSMATALQVTRASGGNQQEVLSRQINYGFNLARLLQVRGGEEDIKSAEALLLQILGVNDKEINTYLSLGLLYERQEKRDEAVAEYKKILEILPEEDSKARENIQKLIDTVEQGGSNVDQNDQGSVEEAVEQNSEVSDIVQEDEEEEKKENVLVISGSDAGDRAEEGKGILEAVGYKIDIREEQNEYEDVTIMYGKESKDEAQTIEESLKNVYENIEVERNDEEVAKYNHEIVVIVGVKK